MLKEAYQNPIVITAFQLAQPIWRLPITNEQTNRQTKKLKIVVLSSTTLIKVPNNIFLYFPCTDTDPLKFYYKHRLRMLWNSNNIND